METVLENVKGTKNSRRKFLKNTSALAGGTILLSTNSATCSINGLQWLKKCLYPSHK